jgi:UDP-N-acetylglucosamine 2-epimerase (non-hydrolysing)
VSSPQGAERPTVLVVYGTRPEAIKMAPVVAALRARAELGVRLCATAQHREMLDQVQALFGLRADRDLDLMRPDQSLNELTARALAALDGVLREERPAWVLVQGDTTTAMAATLAAFHRGIPVGHVEAGLRTGDLAQPFPEEANRRIVDLLATAAFAPTTRAARALHAEGVPAERVYLTGNTVVDALELVAARLDDEAPQTVGEGAAAVGGGPAAGVEHGAGAGSAAHGDVSPAGEVLVTIHRRESFGAPLAGILEAIAELAAAFPEVRFVYPVHPNPNVRGPATARLSGLANVELHLPFDYRELVRRLRRSTVVLTDSGGIQEEAPTFGKPTLVLRETTERPEGVEAGVAKLVGTDRRAIVEAARELLADPAARRAMQRAGNPYGDGRAAARIAAILAGERDVAPFRG